MPYLHMKDMVYSSKDRKRVYNMMALCQIAQQPRAFSVDE